MVPQLLRPIYDPQAYATSRSTVLPPFVIYKNSGSSILW